MKRLSICILLIAVFASLLPAWQKTYDEESVEMRQLKAFSRISATAVPSPTSPFSASQMLLLINSFDREKMPEYGRRQLDNLKSRMEDVQSIFSRQPDTHMNLSVSVNPELFFHTDSDTEVDDWIYQYRNWLPLTDLDAQFWLGRNVYAMTDINLSLRKQRYKKGMFFLNTHREIAEFELSLPSKAYMSIGTDNLSLIAGRDRLSAGNGITGNLLLGDNHWWKDFMKLSVVSLPFSYDFSIIAFDKNSDYEKDPLDLETFNLDSEHKIVIIHRFSMTPWKWLGITVSEGSLQFGSNILSDLRLINPFMMIHGTNGYTSGNQNNFFGVELQFLPFSGLELNVSTIFDQIQVKAELDDGKVPDNSPPNAYGVLFNCLYSLLFKDGIGTFYGEFVYTSPCLYLKNEFGGYHYYDTNLIVGNSLWDDGSSDLSYLGYKYGPDTIVFGAGFDYSRLEGLEYGIGFLFKAHGEHGIRSRVNQRDTIDLGSAHFHDISPTYTEGVTKPEYRVVLSGYVEADICAWMSLSFNAAYVRDWNHNNVIGVDYRDLELSLGFKVHTPH